MLKGLVLEGVCASGKSKVVSQILGSDRLGSLPQKSLICLTEHHTQRVIEQLEDTGTITTEDNVELLRGICEWIEQRTRFEELRTWDVRGKTQHRIAFLFERFHLTHCVHYPHVQWADMVPIDEVLSRLGTRLVLLTASADTLWDRLERRSDHGWKKYMRRIGQDRAEVIEHYVSQQEEMKMLVSRSCLSSLVLSNDEESPDSVANKVIDFWMS